MKYIQKCIRSEKSKEKSESKNVNCLQVSQELLFQCEYCRQTPE